MHHVAYFLVYNVLAKFQLFCIIICRDILYFVFWLPYCHTLWHHQYLICIIQKLLISLERYEIWQKLKHHSSSLLKAFQIHLFFDTSIFHFIGTLTKQMFFLTFCADSVLMWMMFVSNHVVVDFRAIRLVLKTSLWQAHLFGYREPAKPTRRMRVAAPHQASLLAGYLKTCATCLHQSTRIKLTRHSRAYRRSPDSVSSSYYIGSLHFISLL